MTQSYQSIKEGIDKLYRDVYEEYISCLETERRGQRKLFFRPLYSRREYIDQIKSQLDRLFNLSNELLLENVINKDKEVKNGWHIYDCKKQLFNSEN